MSDIIGDLGSAFVGALSQGMLWGIMVLGVYITYRILNVADLTVDGSFAFGACVSVYLMATYKMNPLLALLLAAMAGMIAGAITGVLHTVFEIPAILAGILTQISLWSVNLGIMGKSNISLLNASTIFTQFQAFTGLKDNMVSLVLGLIIVIITIAVLYWFFGTEIGATLRATGNNEAMIRALGVNTGKTKLLGLILSNALVGLAGALVAQNQKYADINMGTGAIVIGLAAIVIGEVLMGRLINFAFKFASTVLGSVVYFIIRALVLQMGLNANYMRALSAVLVFMALAVPVMSRKWKEKRAYSAEGRR